LPKPEAPVGRPAPAIGERKDETQRDRDGMRKQPLGPNWSQPER
jgi:hypothetical protein